MATAVSPEKSPQRELEPGFTPRHFEVERRDLSRNATPWSLICPIAAHAALDHDPKALISPRNRGGSRVRPACRSQAAFRRSPTGNYRAIRGIEREGGATRLTGDRAEGDPHRLVPTGPEHQMLVATEKARMVGEVVSQLAGI